MLLLLLCGLVGEALAVQVAAMALLVFRSHLHDARGDYVRAALKTARLLLGVLALAALELLASTSSILSFGPAWLVRLLFFAFGSSTMSDYVCHRFIWHAHWSIQTTGWERWFFTFVRGHVRNLQYDYDYSPSPSIAVGVATRV